MNYIFLIYLFIMIRSYYMSLYCRSLARTAVDVYTYECIGTSFWRENGDRGLGPPSLLLLPPPLPHFRAKSTRVHECRPMCSCTLPLRSQNAIKLYAAQLTNSIVIINVNTHTNMVLSKDLMSL